jgi:predicted nucleotide-binding protein
MEKAMIEKLRDLIFDGQQLIPGSMAHDKWAGHLTGFISTALGKEECARFSELFSAKSFHESLAIQIGYLEGKVFQLLSRSSPIVAESTVAAMPEKSVKPLGGTFPSASASQGRNAAREAIKPQRPRLFIGSSSEGLRPAEALQANLDRDAECTIWSQGVFGLSNASIESLERQLRSSQFAVLVLTADDATESRGEKRHSPRDNVIFELGLFMGALGRARTFIVKPRSQDLKMPSDLAGIGAADYDDSRSDGNLRAALGAAATDIKEAIRSSRSSDCITSES